MEANLNDYYMGLKGEKLFSYIPVLDAGCGLVLFSSFLF